MGFLKRCRRLTLNLTVFAVKLLKAWNEKQNKVKQVKKFSFHPLVLNII